MQVEKSPPAPSLEAFRSRLEDSRTTHVRCHYIDYLGLARGREVSSEYLLRNARRGVPLAPVNYTWDITDSDYDRRYGPEAGDVFLVPDPDSFVPIPYLPGNGQVFGDIFTVGGKPWPGCTRQALKRVASVAEDRLGSVLIGFEQEGFLLIKDAVGYRPAGAFKHHTSDFFDVHQAFMAELLADLGQLGSPVEKFNLEDGHGQVELNTPAAHPLGASERYFRLRQAFRHIAGKHGFVGTFMPKPFGDIAGAGLHVHLSIRDPAGVPVFGDSGKGERHGLSDPARHFIGGLLSHADALVALACPTVNSYKRLRPGAFAPTHAAYGIGNRSAMIRVVRSAGGSEPDPDQHIEVRTADGTCNPHLLSAALLAAGLDGVERRTEPGEPIAHDLGAMSEQELAVASIRRLPANLAEALMALESDAVIRAALGDEIVNGFLRIKRIEWAGYAAHVSDWELAQYAEHF
jgi:glutamine synthetase